MNAVSVVVTCEVVGTLNHYKMVKKNFELCALCLVLALALSLVLAPVLALTDDVVAVGKSND